jgi:signal transduction histidine kinase
LIGATPPDGRIRFAFSTHPHRLDLSIHTTARAAGETLESVFEPFAPVLGPPGLAFVLARRLAESQGGGLVATGRDDEGTTFLLSLPRPGPILQDRLSRQAAGRQRQRRP